MNKITIIHFRAIKDYPPVINLTRYLASRKLLITLLAGKKNKDTISLPAEVCVKEFSIEKDFLPLEYLRYFWFYFSTFVDLVRTKETPILYFESISAIPVWAYFFIFRDSKRPLFIHYHEYFTRKEYRSQTFLERLGRAIEPFLFTRAAWISHTNQDRLTFYKNDFPHLRTEQLRVMPNYPSQQWLRPPRKVDQTDAAIRLVYIGSLSIEGTYIGELIGWLKTQMGKVTCDIYSRNASAEVISLITAQPQNLISYKGSIDYDNLPEVLPRYHVGLVLYNGSSTNFIYNAPNKIFEYLACGLDVWCPDVLVSAKPYRQTDIYPRLVMIDFSKLNEFDYKAVINHHGLTYSPSPYTMEAVYETLNQEIIHS